MSDRSQDWLAQARRDLEHAVHSCDYKEFEWACFSAQQAGEKAVKAVYFHLHAEGWGHSVFNLLKSLPEKAAVPEGIIDAAKVLDKHYIPTRYPNGFDRGIPADYYTRKEAEQAIEYARTVIEFCEGLLR
jgi:HEPN domain-containing protein